MFSQVVRGSTIILNSTYQSYSSSVLVGVYKESFIKV